MFRGFGLSCAFNPFRWVFVRCLLATALVMLPAIHAASVEMLPVSDPDVNLVSSAAAGSGTDADVARDAVAGRNEADRHSDDAKTGNAEDAGPGVPLEQTQSESATGTAEIGGDAKATAVDPGMSEAVIRRIIQNQEDILKFRDELNESREELERSRQEINRLKARVEEMAAARETESAARGKQPLFKPSFELRIRPDFAHNCKSLGTRKAVAGQPDTVEDQDAFMVSERLRLGFSIVPADGYRFVITIQDARNWGDERHFKYDNKSLDLFEGYIQMDDIGKTGLSLTAGRFSFFLGSRMHVDAGYFGSTGQTYDGIRLKWGKKGILKIDAFSTFVKSGLGPVFSDGKNEDYEIFSGVYLSTDKPSEYVDAELYGFYLDDAFANFTQHLGTVGGRLLLRPTDGMLISGEAAAQFGTVSNWTAAANLQTADHLAAVYLANFSYKFLKTPAQPSIGAFFLYATGDSNPWDTDSTAFKPVFGSTHAFLGWMDLFRASGVWDIGPSFVLQPVPELELFLDYHFMFQTADGGLYQHFGTNGGNGTRNGSWTMDRGLLVPAGNDSFYGHELDFAAIWNPLPWLEASLAYSAFFPGSGLDNATITGVNETDGANRVWVDEAVLGGRIAHRLVVWTTLHY